MDRKHPSFREKAESVSLSQSLSLSKRSVLAWMGQRHGTETENFQNSAYIPITFIGSMEHECLHCNLITEIEISRNSSWTRAPFTRTEGYELGCWQTV